MPRRRITAGLAVIAVAAMTVVALAERGTHSTAAAHSGSPPLAESLRARDLPVPIPLPRSRPAVHTRAVRTPVPILMYHAIGTPPAGAPYPSLFVSAQLFRAQVRAIRHAGYHAVTLNQVWGAWHGRARLPHKPIVLSFDDGYRGDYGVAMPTLHRLGWPGVLNLLVANLHRRGWGIKTWMVRRMIRDGWEVDSHTLTHPALTTLSPAQLWREVHVSRVVLRRLFHVPVDFFCYPSGDFDATVVAAVRRAGYLAATTTLPGLGEPSQPYTLRRVRVDGGETPAFLLAMVTANWHA